MHAPHVHVMTRENSNWPPAEVSKNTSIPCTVDGSGDFVYAQKLWKTMASLLGKVPRHDAGSIGTHVRMTVCTHILP